MFKSSSIIEVWFRVSLYGLRTGESLSRRVFSCGGDGYKREIGVKVDSRGKLLREGR
jgi:hypothetical protein